MNYEEYKKKGYLISDKILSKEEVLSIRKDLDYEFDINDKKIIYLHDFKNEQLVKKILNLYKHKILKDIKSELEKISNRDLSILPNFLVQKNYHVNLKQFHGWHRDCGGELKYNYCNEILNKKNYFFSKIAFYLQENTEFGGSIDIIKSSHKNFSKYKIFIRKLKSIPLRLIMFFHARLKKIYNLIPETFFMSFLNAKRLYPKLGSAVIFDSRIVHRGSPISRNKLNEVKFKDGLFEAEIPDDYTKYSIYCHFGTSDGIDSYMYDRSKRKDSVSIKEIKTWIKQIEYISKIEPELGEKMRRIFNPIQEKYQNPS